MSKFFSNGKLLLTGEYLVLKGAEAIAIPLKLGQSFSVTPLDENVIYWKSFYKDAPFFEGKFSSGQLQILETNDTNVSNYLKELLNKAFEINQKKLDSGFTIETHLDFPLHWGLGSSSSLINNISRWLEIDAFFLNKEITGGSGYDIACTESDNPILYKMNNGSVEYSEFYWEPPYKENLFFIYTGKKQDSAREVKHFTKKNKVTQAYNTLIQKINKDIIQSATLEDFEQAISEHEILLSKILKKKKAQDNYFNNFPGKIKSLGAWGGDFILVTWRKTKEELKDYLKKYHLNTVFSWDEIIKTNKP